MIDSLKSLISIFSIVDVIDIAIVSYLVYKLLSLVKGSRIIYMFISIILLLFAWWLSDFLHLKVVHWLFIHLSGYLLLAIIILFQQELRRGLTLIGNSKFFKITVDIDSQVVDEVVASVVELADKGIGALIVLQRDINVRPLIQVGEYLDAVVSGKLLYSLFVTTSPLHDGAVIIDGNRVKYAGCILPLTNKDRLPIKYGTRHRAAIGITDETDAVVLVVSEERGIVSLVYNGEIAENLDEVKLKSMLHELFILKNKK